MPTDKETIAFILSKLREPKRFTVRAMFGEYALYADGQVVALVCDDRMHVKLLPASTPLESLCEKGYPYPGAKLHYVIDEAQLSTIPNLAAVLFAVATARRSQSKKKKKEKDKKPARAQKP